MRVIRALPGAVCFFPLALMECSEASLNEEVFHALRFKAEDCKQSIKGVRS